MKWIIFLPLILPVMASCPKKLQKEIANCMAPVKGYSNEISAIGMLQSELETTEELCSDGSIQNVFDCLSKLYNRCAKTKDASRHLNLAVDPNKWRDAMNNICNHIYYLKDQAECEDRVKTEFSSCVTIQLKNFKEQKETLDESPEPNRMESLIHLTCVNADKVLNCLRRPYEKYCPRPMTTLLINTVKGFTPKMCANLIPTLDETDKGRKSTFEPTNPDKVDVFHDDEAENEDRDVKPPQYWPSQDNPHVPPSRDVLENRGVVGTAKKQQSGNGTSNLHPNVALSVIIVQIVAAFVSWVK
ncbi:uncharacterized protein LOC106054756 [Biomphalaria glabrata]|uniref:Uncharacterized protein LOC106054756 n=1 Tax=Biomphalaria glabrata TaxID=6526 RepID=A0A9W3A8L7_BIOGL|nr:uncharacterized protein LOC106054756 [Biomphalaria glabrata]XP_055883523.1 uncharacterized protein LOC106054756 [Biomphalaria glabrata]